MITSFSILSFVQSIAFVLMLHPLHVSVTEIEYDEKDKALEIMMRVFIDDLELTMRDRLNQPELDITEPKGITLDQMMTPYLAERFKITLDNKAQKIKYLGHEKEGEAFIFFIEVANVKKWKAIQVMNNIIMETHEDQSNLVHVTVRGKVKSLRLTKSTPADVLTFDAK
jgi:hypothetical protein